jgi:hypothetical protein
MLRRSRCVDLASPSAQGFGPPRRRATPSSSAVLPPYWLYDPWSGSTSTLGPYPYPYPYPYRYYNVDPGRRDAHRGHAARSRGLPRRLLRRHRRRLQRRVSSGCARGPGQHEIVLYLDGYRTVHQKLYLTPKNTIKVKYAMEPLAAGEQPEARPEGAAASPAAASRSSARRWAAAGHGPRGPATRRAPQGPPRGNASAYGTLAIRVQPIDADV